MDYYDDIQVEDFSSFDFAEAMNDGLFDEDEDEKSFQDLINSNYEY